LTSVRHKASVSISPSRWRQAQTGLVFFQRKEGLKHGIERGQVRAKDVKTLERARVFALIRAMRIARIAFKRASDTIRTKVLTVTVFCSMPVVVGLINHHRTHKSKSLESVVSPEDRSMVKEVLECVRRLSRYNVNVSVVADGEEGSTVCAARAKGLAHQRKKKACRRHRRERRTVSANVGAADQEEEDEGSDTVGNGIGDSR
jgi:hypothetical protein